MGHIPPKLRQKLAVNPFYGLCARQEALHDHECQPDPLTGRLIEWEHAMMHAGKQINAEWAILPLCWYVHRGPGLIKKINEWIALNRATDTEIVDISRAQDYFLYRAGLNKMYGPYTAPKLPETVGINYGREYSSRV